MHCYNAKSDQQRNCQTVRDNPSSYQTVNSSLRRKHDYCDIKLLYTNIDTITNKKHELLAKITETEAKIIVVTEVNPKNCRYHITNSELNIDNFTLYYNSSSVGRGVCIFVHCSLKSVKLPIQIIGNWCCLP